MWETPSSKLRSLGFVRAGVYRNGEFAISEGWRARRGVYVWTHGTGTAIQPLRVGIACGSRGFGGRYDSYNRWLAGRFKPNDPREQKKSVLFREGLRNSADVWAIELPDKKRALELELALRRHWGSLLHLDPMVRDSWSKARLNEWSAERRLQSEATSPLGLTSEPAHASQPGSWPAVLPVPAFIVNSRGWRALALWLGFFCVAAMWLTMWVVGQLLAIATKSADTRRSA